MQSILLSGRVGDKVQPTVRFSCRTGDCSCCHVVSGSADWLWVCSSAGASSWIFSALPFWFKHFDACDRYTDQHKNCRLGAKFPADFWPRVKPCVLFVCLFVLFGIMPLLSLWWSFVCGQSLDRVGEEIFSMAKLNYSATLCWVVAKSLKHLLRKWHCSLWVLWHFIVPTMVSWFTVLQFVTLVVVCMSLAWTQSHSYLQLLLNKGCNRCSTSILFLLVFFFKSILFQLFYTTSVQ